MNGMCLRLDLSVARAAVLLLDGIDKDTVDKNDLFQSVKTIEELEQLRAVAKMALATIEAACGLHNMPLPNPRWEKPSWVMISSPEEIEEQILNIYHSQMQRQDPIAEGT